MRAATVHPADEPADGSLEVVLRTAVEAVARVTGAGAVLLTLDAAGAVERLSAASADGCVRETLLRADVLGPLVVALRARGRTIGRDDVPGDAAQLLDAVAPNGFFALPVGPAVGAGVRGLLMLIEPDTGPVLDEAAVGIAAVLAVIAGEAVTSIRRVATLREACEDLRRLAADVLSRRDRESEATAHDLHERLCQDLAGASVELQAVEHLLDVPELRTRVRDARRLVTGTIGELRELAQRLRPVTLGDFGYVQALRSYAGRLREQAGISLLLDVEGEDRRLPAEMESALYRATEEALASAGRRRGAVRVSYRHRPSAVQLEIAGTDPGAIELAAMRERLRPFRGVVRVTTPDDAPPVLALELPLN